MHTSNNKSNNNNNSSNAQVFGLRPQTITFYNQRGSLITYLLFRSIYHEYLEPLPIIIFQALVVQKHITFFGCYRGISTKRFRTKSSVPTPVVCVITILRLGSLEQKDFEQNRASQVPTPVVCNNYFEAWIIRTKRFRTKSSVPSPNTRCV